MTDQPGTALTLRQILKAQEPQGAGVEAGGQPDTVAGSLGPHLQGVPATLRAAAAEQILALVATVLDRRLVDLLASGWRKWEQLSDAARRTLLAPGQVEIVELIDHEISSIQRPSVDVIYDRRRVAQIAAEVAVNIDVHAATAVVEDGRLSALRSGHADLDARMSIEGIVVVEAERQLELAVEIPLGDGIPLMKRPEPVLVLADPETARPS
jgi:hypothetical protein